MAFHPLSNPLAPVTVDCTVAQGHPYNWSEGENVKREEWLVSRHRMEK